MTELENFLHPVSQLDLRGVYWIDTSQVDPQLSSIDNESTELRLSLLQNTPDGNKLTYFVTLYTLATEPVFEQALQRWLCDNKLCLGRPRQRCRVAIRVGFYLRPRFRGAGLASYLLPREEDAFRRWGAREIQLLAVDLGRWVWTRTRFAYNVDQFELQSLQQKYKEWQRARGTTSTHRPADVSGFPREFLLAEVQSLNLFKSL